MALAQMSSVLTPSGLRLGDHQAQSLSSTGAAARAIPSACQLRVPRRADSRRASVRVQADGAVTTAVPEAPAEKAGPIESSFPAPPTVLDINRIKELLPHRFPFLLVDRVIEYTPGVSAVGIKCVTVNDNFFPGHFPERPIMPGVLMVEAMAQVGGLVLLTDEVGGNRESFFFAGVDKVRFRKPVVPGDTLVMRMTLTKLQRKFGIAKMEGKAYVGKDVVCEGEFLLALGKA